MAFKLANSRYKTVYTHFTNSCVLVDSWKHNCLLQEPKRNGTESIKYLTVGNCACGSINVQNKLKADVHGVAAAFLHLLICRTQHICTIDLL